MRRKSTAILALAIVCLVGAAALAADDAAKPLGKWKRELGDNSMSIEIKADSMQVIMKAAENELKITASYTIKDGVLSGVMKKIERKGFDGGPEEGDKFTFNFKVDKDKLTVSKLTGTDSDEAKQLVEGEYTKQKKEEKK